MTVSKTTTQELARKFILDNDNGLGQLGVGPRGLAEFADSLTAELQKENARLKEIIDGIQAIAKIDDDDCQFYEKEVARLREALEKIMGCVGTSTESWHIADEALAGRRSGGKK